MDIIGKSHPTPKEYLMGRVFCAFDLKKLNSDKVKKIMEHVDNQ